MAYKILVADDESTIRRILKIELEHHGYQVTLAKNGKEAVDFFQMEVYDAAIFDIRMPELDGYGVLKEIRKSSKSLIIIMITAFATIDGAVSAMKMGADDYIIKPFDNEEVLERLDQHLQLRNKKEQLVGQPIEDDGPLLGNNELMLRVKKQINKINDLDTTALITGESGTGKGVVAKTIHNTSRRKNLPFVHVDCAFLPENLMETELFGHEKGAFTNAIELRKGKFELAQDGTIFLDEIGTLPLNLQAKLLNVLQERFVYRVGGSQKIHIKARILAATNENLEAAVEAGKFREDLYYRLNVVRIECPPLRYRKEDTLALAKHFLSFYAGKIGKQICSVSEEVWGAIKDYDWPGNVRELEHVHTN